MPDHSRLLVLADQQTLFRAALAELLIGAGWRETRQIETRIQLLDLLGQQSIDLLMIDLFFGDLDVLRFCQSLTERQAALKVLLLTAYEREAISQQLPALLAGAAGCLSKQHGADLYIEAIRLILRGMVLFQHETIQAALRIQHQATLPPAEPPEESNPRLLELTQRELEILELIAEGRGNPEIARILNITENTVMKHASHIMAKLRVRNRTEAAFIYLRSGIHK
jgi:DNA-binding NarL/FixJ family response regulator